MTRLQAAYDILGISPDSDEATVKAAWRALVRTYHPDMARTDPEGATRRLAEINAAFDAIGAASPDQRHKLAEAAAHRARKAAQARRKAAEAAAKARAANHAARARAAAAAAASDRKGEAEKADTAARAKTERAATADQQALWHLARQAAETFQAAQKICSRELKAAPRSAYF